MALALARQCARQVVTLFGLFLGLGVTPQDQVDRRRLRYRGGRGAIVKLSGASTVF